MMQLRKRLQLEDIPVTPAQGGLMSERMIPLNETAKLFPRPNGRLISKLSLWRWATKGLVSRGRGKRVKLETFKGGQIRYTSYEAIQRFANAVDGRDANDPPPVPGLRPLRSRKADVLAATEKLKAEGFM